MSATPIPLRVLVVESAPASSAVVYARAEFLMRDPAKWRVWMIFAALAFFVVATFIVDRLMH